MVSSDFTSSLIVATLATVLSAVPILDAHPTPDPRTPVFQPAQVRSQRFRWEGSCTVRCQGGQCRVVCESGVVYSDTVPGAKLEAEALLRAQASAQGIVLEGSARVSVRLDL